MLEYLKIVGAGPKTENRVIELDFAEGRNVITGDNGLGKTFLLDVAWWAMTRTWVSRDRMTLPQRDRPKSDKATISYKFSTTKGKTAEFPSQFDWPNQQWPQPKGRPGNPGMVLYAQVDGGFSVWDPARNYKLQSNILPDAAKLPASYILDASEVWNGYPREKPEKLCQGLLVDWASWKRENGRAWELMQEVIHVLSPSGEEPITAGELTRIRLDDVRDMPTLRMPYGQDVPLIHASAGMRRIISLAYLLVWTWEEHRRASALLNQAPVNQVTFLIDEIESHLHPKWQRQIVTALSKVMEILTKSHEAKVQIIMTTHAPLVLASLEGNFNDQRDRLFHLDFNGQFATVEQMQWARHGDASNWLTSPVFALAEARSLDAQLAIQAAQAWMAGRNDDLKVPLNTQEAIDAALRASVPATDDVMFQWQLAIRGGYKT